MPQAALTGESSCAQSNDIAFKAPANTFMTFFMFNQVAQAAQVLPAGWFDVSLQRDEDVEVRRDHVIIKRIAGPPVGSFNVRRGLRGRFRVVHMGESNEAADGAESGPYRTVEAAIEAIRTDIALRLAAWGVMPVARAA